MKENKDMQEQKLDGFCIICKTTKDLGFADSFGHQHCEACHQRVQLMRLMRIKGSKLLFTMLQRNNEKE